MSAAPSPQHPTLTDFATSGAGEVSNTDPNELAHQVRSAIEQFRKEERERAQVAHSAAARLARAGHQNLHDEVLMSIPVDFVKEWQIRRSGTRIPLGCSFTASMAQYRQRTKEERRLRGRTQRGIFKKEFGREYAKRLGLAVAKHHQTNVDLTDLTPRPGTVIKPARGNGSKGVIVYTRKGELYELKSKAKYQDWDEVKRALGQWIDEGYLLTSRFHLEELLEGPDGDIPHDVKFYAFYGQIGLTLEIQRGVEENSYCFYKGGVEVDTGQYAGRRLSGAGIPPEWESLAAMVSLSLPLPFVRLDFYRTNKGLYMGEFTRWPGTFENFNLEYDRYLGNEFVKADVRLQNDLANGKTFSEYMSYRYG